VPEWEVCGDEMSNIWHRPTTNVQPDNRKLYREQKAAPRRTVPIIPAVFGRGIGVALWQMANGIV